MSSEAHDTNAEVDGTQADKINTGALATLVAVGLLAMLSITAAVTALVRHDIEGEESQKDADQNQPVIQLKNYQRGLLNGRAGYLDRGKGVVSLPIDVAQSVVVSELQKDPNSATPPAPPTTASAEVAAAVAPPAADAGAPAPADSAVTSTNAGAKGEPPGKAEPAKDKPAPAPEKATDSKPAPATSAKPATPASAAPAPKPAPTAATTGALEPGPINH